MNRMQLIELSVYSMYRVYTIESIGYRGLQYLTHGENETRWISSAVSNEYHPIIRMKNLEASCKNDS